MSKRNGRSRRSPNQDSSWKDRVHFVDFSYDEVNHIREWVKGFDDNVWVFFEELADSGFAIKVTPPGSGDEWWVTLQCKDGSHELNGHSFIFKYPDLPRCILLAFWWHSHRWETYQTEAELQATAKAWLD